MMKKMAVWTDISPDYFHFLLSILYHQGALPTFICKLFVLEGQTDEIWGGGGRFQNAVLFWQPGSIIQKKYFVFAVVNYMKYFILPLCPRNLVNVEFLY